MTAPEVDLTELGPCGRPAPERGLRVLLVDDDPDVLDMLYAMLSMQGWWEIVGRASTGSDAMRVAQNISPDVAVLDHMMPGTSGVALAAELKGRHPRCVVVLFSASDLPAAEQAHAMVDHHLNKLDVGRLPQLLDQVARNRILAERSP